MQTRTRRQREVLDFISRYIDNHGFEPSYQSIARHLGISSKAGVAKHVKALESQGLLKTRNPDGKFLLEVTHKNGREQRNREIRWLDCPNNEWPEDLSSEPFSVPDFLLGTLTSDQVFAFRVPDNFMEGKNVCEGDIALVESRSFVRDGDIAAVVIKESSTLLRTYFRNGANVELRTSDDGRESILFPSEKVRVVGLYRGLIRPIK